MKKKWFMSKTIQFNVLYTVAEVCLVALDFIPAEYVPLLMAVQGIANVVIRVWYTNMAIDAELK